MGKILALIFSARFFVYSKVSVCIVPMAETVDCLISHVLRSKISHEARGWSLWRLYQEACLKSSRPVSDGWWKRRSPHVCSERVQVSDVTSLRETGGDGPFVLGSVSAVEKRCKEGEQ